MCKCNKENCCMTLNRLLNYPVSATGKKATRHFSGKFDEATLGMYITKVIYNKPVTVVLWSDGTKTMCKCQEGDIYNKETGLMLCVLKKLIGSEHTIKLLDDWVSEDTNMVDLRVVRAKGKDAKKQVKVEEVKEEPVVKRGRPRKKSV